MRDETAHRAQRVKIALVVGTILNRINQGEGIVANGAISWTHFVLNYLLRREPQRGQERDDAGSAEGA